MPLPGRWWRLFGLMCLGRAADVAATWYADKGSLANESNGLVQLFGGWTTLLALTTLVVAFTASLSAWAYRRPFNGHPLRPGLSRPGLQAHLLFGPGAATRDLVWRVPPVRGLLYAIGCILPGTIAGASLVFAAHNLGLRLIDGYAELVAPLFFGFVPLFTLLAASVAALLSSASWLRWEWHGYQQRRPKATRGGRRAAGN